MPAIQAKLPLPHKRKWNLWEQFYSPPPSYIDLPLNLYLLPLAHRPLFSLGCVSHVCCRCSWQVMLTRRKSKLKEKRKNLQVSCNNFFVVTKDSFHHLCPFLILELPAALADLQGMWYPTVRRTLVCLSKLYRCISVSLLVLVDHLWWYLDMLGIPCSTCRSAAMQLFIILHFLSVPERNIWRFVSRSFVLVHSVP